MMEHPLRSSRVEEEGGGHLGVAIGSKEYRSVGDSVIESLITDHRLTLQQELRTSLFEGASQGRVDGVEHILGSSRICGVLCLPSVTRIAFFQCKDRFQQAVASSTNLNIPDTDVRVHSVENGVVESANRSKAEAEEAASPEGWEDAAEEDTWAQEQCVFVAFSICPSHQVSASSLQEIVEDSDSFLNWVLRELNKGKGKGGEDEAHWFGWFEGKMQVIQCSIDARDSSGASALHWAAVNDHFRMPPILVREGADINSDDKDGQTALHWACLKGRTKAVAALIDAKADINVQDKWGFTGVMRAAQGGHLIAMLVLLRAGADTSKVDHEGHTVLQWAVFKRDHAGVDWLLKEASVRATIDNQDQNGAAALHLACRYSGWEMCRKLLAAGARRDMINAENQTPQQVARKYKRAVTLSVMSWYVRMPAPIKKLMVLRGRYNRAFEVLPTCHCFWAMLLICIGVGYYLAVLLPGTIGTGWGLLWICHVIFLLNFIPMMVSFWKSWRGDPGIIPAQPEAVIQGVLAEELSESDIMLVAMAPRVPRAKYSRFFGVYVARFDHDCPWISNVVGAGNHHWFFAFVVTVTACWCVACYAFVSGTSYAHALQLCVQKHSNSNSSFVSSSSVEVPHGWDPERACPLMGKDMVSYAVLHHSVSASLMVLYVIFLLFTAIMVVCQAQQIAQNVTTNELINSSRYEGWQRADGTWQNPYDRGVVNNCREFCRCYPSHSPAAVQYPFPVSPTSSAQGSSRRGGRGINQEMVSLLPASVPGTGSVAGGSSEGDSFYAHNLKGSSIMPYSDDGRGSIESDTPVSELLSAQSRRRTAVLEHAATGDSEA